MLREINNLEQNTKLVLHTSTLRIPQHVMDEILATCKSKGIRVQLPAAYFYEFYTLRKSELFGAKVRAFVESLVKNGIELFKESIEDMYHSESAYEQTSNDTVYLVNDTLKLEEMIKFSAPVYRKQRIMVPTEMLHNMSSKTNTWVVRTIEEVEPLWKGCEMVPYVREETASQKRMPKEFFAGPSYVKANKCIKETEEARFYTIKGGSGEKSSSILKIYHNSLEEEDAKERLRLLKEAIPFFRNVQPINKLLYKKGDTSIVCGILTEMVNGKTLSSFLEEGDKSLSTQNFMYEGFLRTLLELNLCGIYYTNIDIKDLYVNAANRIIFTAPDAFQIKNYSGAAPKDEYCHPTYKEGDIIYPIYQNYAVGKLLLQAVSVSSGRFESYRLFSRIFEREFVPLGNYIELLQNGE